MMEDDRCEWRKQNDPDFVASAASGGSSTNPHEAGKDDEGADDVIFDAALEKRRKHRREMKYNTHSKLDKLVDVAWLSGCTIGICGGGTGRQAPYTSRVGSHNTTIGGKGSEGPGRGRTRI